MFELVVTRHQGLVDYLREEEMIDEFTTISSHATAEIVTGRHVLGVLPHSLSCLAESFTEIPLNLPAELRGKELTAEDVRQYGGRAVTYRVERLDGFAKACQGHIGWYDGQHPDCCGNCEW